MASEKPNLTRIYNHSWGWNEKVPATHHHLGEARIAENCHRDSLYGIEKRRGNVFRTQPSGDTRITGIYDFQKISPTGAGSDGTAYEGEDGTPIHEHLYSYDNGEVYREQENGNVELVAGFVPSLTNSRFTTFAQSNGYVYMARPGAAPAVYDGDRMYKVGIVAPTDAMTGADAPAVGAAGNLNGTYTYKVTLIFETEDGRTIESNPSPVSTAVAPANQQVSLTWAALGATAQANLFEHISGYRIYRRKDGATVGENDFFLITTITDITTTAYTDNTADIDVGVLVSLDNNPPPTGGQVIFYNQMLFILGADGDPHGIQHSRPGDFESFPASHFLKFYSRSTSPIVGAKELNGVLVVFFEDAIYHVTGTSVSTLRIRKMTENIGCVAPGSIQDLGNVIAFLWKDGLYGWDLTRPHNFGQPIEPFVEGASRELQRQAYGAVYRELDHYYLALPNADGTTPWIVFDYTTDPQLTSDMESRARRVPRAWFKYTGENDGLAATAMASCQEFTTKREIVLWGNAVGEVFQADSGTTDNGAPITMRWKAFVPPVKVGRELADIEALPQFVRHWVVYYDKWTGTAKFGYGYFDSELEPYVGGETLMGEESFTKSVSEYGSVRINCKGHGYIFFVDIRHDTAGEFRFVIQEFIWDHRGQSTRRRFPEG